MVEWKKASRYANASKRPSRHKQRVRKETHRFNRRQVKNALNKGKEIPMDIKLDAWELC